MYNKALIDLDKPIRTGLKTALGVTQFTNNNIVYAETGTMPIALRAKQPALKYYAKVMYQGDDHPMYKHIKATGDHPHTGCQSPQIAKAGNVKAIDVKKNGQGKWYY